MDAPTIRRAIAVAFGALVLLADASLSATPPMQPHGARTRLIRIDAHTIPVTLRELVGPPAGVEATCIIPQTLAHVWGVLSDYDHLEKVVPFVTESRVLRRDGDTIMLYQEGRGGLSLFQRRFSVTFRVHETPMREIRFEAFKGDFTQFTGFWRLEPHADGTLVHHQVSIEPAFYLPRWVMRLVMRHMLLRGVEAVIQRCLRGSLENG